MDLYNRSVARVLVTDGEGFLPEGEFPFHLGTLELSVDEVGASGSGLEILSVALPETGEAAQIIEGEPAEAARILVEKLQKEARVL